MGRAVNLVRRLVRELENVGLEAEIAWTPDERRSLVANAGTGFGLPMPGRGGRRRHRLGAGQRTAQGPDQRAPVGDRESGGPAFRTASGTLLLLARTIASGRVARTDLGCAAGRRFLLMTGFGFDGDVVTRHHRSRTSTSGRIKPTHRAAYVEPILRASLFYRFPSIRVRIEDPGAEEELEGTTVFVFNLPRYALGLPFAPTACQDDGLLDLVVFREPGPFQALYYLWRVFRGTHLDHPGVFHRRIRRVRRDLARAGARAARRRSRGVPGLTKPGRQRSPPRTRPRRGVVDRGHSLRGRCADPRREGRPEFRSSERSGCVRIPRRPSRISRRAARSTPNAPGGPPRRECHRGKGGEHGRVGSQSRHDRTGSRSARGRPLALIAGPCVMEPGRHDRPDRPAAGRDLRIACMSR